MPRATAMTWRQARRMARREEVPQALAGRWQGGVERVAASAHSRSSSRTQEVSEIEVAEVATGDEGLSSCAAVLSRPGARERASARAAWPMRIAPSPAVGVTAGEGLRVARRN